MIKRIFILIFLLASISFGQDISGSGTEGDPYILYNAADVDSIRYYSFIAGYYFKLNSDIDLSGYSDWTPIGSTSSYWRNHLDLNGKTISNLTITSLTQNGMGLFGAIGGQSDTATVYNGIIKDPIINVSGTTGGGDLYFIGSLAGSLGFQMGYPLVLNVRIDNPTINVNITDSYQLCVGGSIGRTEGGCDVELLSTFGGSVYLYATVTPGHIRQRCAGGLIGADLGSIINRCFSDARVEIDGTANLFGGGVLGVIIGAGASDTLLNCYSTSRVINNAGYYAGGIIGISDGLSKNCYVASDTVYSTNASNEGLFVGFSSNSVWDTCYADTSISLTNDINTIGLGITLGSPEKTTAQMKTQSTFTNGGWDFTNIWAIDPSINEGYPYLLENSPGIAQYYPFVKCFIGFSP